MCALTSWILPKERNVTLSMVFFYLCMSAASDPAAPKDVKTCVILGRMELGASLLRTVGVPTAIKMNEWANQPET